MARKGKSKAVKQANAARWAAVHLAGWVIRNAAFFPSYYDLFSPEGEHIRSSKDKHELARLAEKYLNGSSVATVPRDVLAGRYWK